MPSKNKLYYVTFPTTAGWIGLYGNEEGLCRSTLPQKSARQAIAMLGDTATEAEENPEYFKKSIEEFRAYFEGRRIDFQNQINLAGATPFLRAIWESTRKIPYGETRTYGWLARQTGYPLAARAVGNAMHKNPLPIIIPCHRVLGSDKRLHGFGGGLEMKQFLLKLEGTSGFHL